jgi:hypothetical protein
MVSLVRSSAESTKCRYWSRCFPGVVATTCWTRSGQSTVKYFLIRPYAACGRMQATRSHHVGLQVCLRRRPSSKGARMPMPTAQRKASTLIDLQGDYDTTMLQYRCGMLHRGCACRPSGVCILAAAKWSRLRCKCRGLPAANGLPRLTVAPTWRDLAGNGECTCR